MGDFFKKEERGKQPDEEEVTLIRDVNTLFSTYNSVSSKIDETTSQGYETIVPIRNSLFGGGQSPDDVGDVGKVRRGLQMSRLRRIELGQRMWQVLDKIEDLDGWSDRYAEYLEEHIKALQVVCRSSFLIMKGLFKDIEERDLRIKQFENADNEEERGNKYIVKTIKHKPITKELALKRFESLIPVYLKHKANDATQLVMMAKARIRNIAENDPEIQDYLEGLFKARTKESSLYDNDSKEETKKNEPEDGVYSPLSRKLNSEIPLLDSENDTDMSDEEDDGQDDDE